MRATAASPSSRDRHAMYTRPPPRASAVAVASPIPVLPPVTRKTRSGVTCPLSARHRAHNEERLTACRDRGCHRLRQRRVRRLVGQVLLARVEADERPPPAGAPVPDRAAEHREPRLKRVQHRPLGERLRRVHADLAIHAGEVPQVRGKHHPDRGHGRTWTSTDSTAGRSRTIGAQESPASAEQYTCPPVVPKYTPHESSVSTAIASRYTFT